jgi:hypothetical protein
MWYTGQKLPCCDQHVACQHMHTHLAMLSTTQYHCAMILCKKRFFTFQCDSGIMTCAFQSPSIARRPRLLAPKSEQPRYLPAPLATIQPMPYDVFLPHFHLSPCSLVTHSFSVFYIKIIIIIILSLAISVQQAIQSVHICVQVDFYHPDSDGSEIPCTAGNSTHVIRHGALLL